MRQSVRVGASLLTATISNGTGTPAYQWQISTDNVTFTNISGATSATYNATGLTATRYYRVNITQTGNGCNNATSATTTITVVSDPSVTLTPASVTICSGGSSLLTATISNGTGTPSYQWQISINNTIFTDISGATSATYNATGLTATTYYRVNMALSGNGCDNGSSISTTVTVVADPTVAVSASNASICSGGSSLLTATISNGTGTPAYQWQISTDNVSFTDISGATSATYNATGLTATRYFRVNITQTGNGCNNATSATSTITVVADPIVTASVPETTICTGGGVVISATYTGGTGTCNFQWQSRPDAVSTWTDIPGATNSTYTTPALNTSNRYRAVLSCSGNGCCD